MNTNSITASQATQTQKTEAPGQLGKNDFLKILVAQLSNQDPMKPMQDTEFIGPAATSDCRPDPATGARTKRRSRGTDIGDGRGFPNWRRASLL